MERVDPCCRRGLGIALLQKWPLESVMLGGLCQPLESLAWLLTASNGGEDTQAVIRRTMADAKSSAVVCDSTTSTKGPADIRICKPVLRQLSVALVAEIYDLFGVSLSADIADLADALPASQHEHRD